MDVSIDNSAAKNCNSIETHDNHNNNSSSNENAKSLETKEFKVILAS